MKKRFVRQTLTMLLAFAMVLTMMPMLAVQTVNANSTGTAPGGTVVSNSKADAEAAFGSGNVEVSEYSNKTLTITVKKNINLNSPVKFQKGNSGDKIILKLMGYTISGKAGTADSSNANATGGNAIEIVASDFNVEVEGSGTVKGGNGAKYETSDHRFLGTDGGMAVAFVDSSWKSTANNGKLNYGLTVTGGARLYGGNGGDLTGDDWLYNIEHYDGSKKYSYAAYDCIGFTLRPGAGGAGIGQTGAYISEGLSDKANTAIVVENGEVIGGYGGMVKFDTNNSPVLTNYGLMHNSVINSYLDKARGSGGYDNQYYTYVVNQVKLLPGRGGDGITIGDGRKYVYVAKDGYVQGGTSGNFDYGNSKYVNQFDSIGAGNVATAGNGISVYGDIGLTNISPTDKTITSGNASSRTKDSNETGIYVAGTVRGGGSPDATAMNEYSGDAGDGIYIDGLYGREDWGAIVVGQGGKILGGDTGNTAYGKVGTTGEAIRERRPKGQDVLDTRFGTDYFIINGEAKGGKGGNSLGVSSAGAGGTGMTFNTYRKKLRIYGTGTVSGGNCGTETDHGQSASTYKPESIHMGTDSSNKVTVNQTRGTAASKVDVDKLDIRATMSSFDQNPTTATQLSLSGIPDGYTGGVFIRWSATIYETSSIGSSTYDIESANTNLKTFNMLSNDSYGSYLAYPTYPGHISIQLNMNNYNADVATVNRMSEDGKYQTDIFCYVVLADGRWGKSPAMRYEKNRGWNGTGYLPVDDGGGEPAPDPDMEYVLSVGQAIKALPAPGEVTANDNSAIVTAEYNYSRLTADQIAKYLYDYDYAAKISACAQALYAIIEDGDLASDNVLLENISNRLDSLPASVSDYTLESNEADVRAAQAAYNNLRDKTKLPAEQKTKLDNAVTKIDALRQAADTGYCRHNIVAVDSKPATCHEKGNITYYKCTGCDAYFSDYNGTNKIENKESVEIPIDANAHVFGEWEKKTNPTCKDPGKNERKCIYHSDVVETEDIPVDSNAHTWGGWETTTAPTCSKPGVETRECSACNNTETRSVKALEHNWGAWEETVEATCALDGLRKHECSNCHTEETEVVPAGHVWGKWTTSKKASCTSGGQEQRVCSRDASHIETRNTAALGHSWSSWTSQQPTEESQGVVTHRCNRCGSTYYTAIAPITLPTDLPYVKVSKPAKGKKAITVKWKKVNKKNQKLIGGIEIQVTGPGVNTVVTAGKKKSSKKIKGLLPKQTYSCRVRAYNYIGGVKHVSAWSNWKTAKTK